MIKYLITATAMVAICDVNAQIAPAADTAHRTGVSITDIKNDIQEELPAIVVNEDDADEGGSGPVSSLLMAGRDPFLSAAAFSFSPVRFRLRGYETRGNTVYINGIDFNGLDNGFTPFGLWSGLNYSMRSRQNIYGLQTADFAMGAIGLNTHIDMRAGVQRAQTQLGYAFSNRNYNHRLVFSHGSGFNQKGWAYSIAFTGRYAYESYIPGTYHESASYYAAVDKKIKGRNRL